MTKIDFSHLPYCLNIFKIFVKYKSNTFRISDKNKVRSQPSNRLSGIFESRIDITIFKSN